MKRAVLVPALIFLISAFGWAFARPQGTPPARTVVYSLEPGEEILMPESSLCITMDGEHVTLVLAKGKEGPFFVVRDGVKKGPFTKLAEAMKVADEGRCDKPLRGSECAMYNPAPEAMDMASIMGDEAGGQVIRFNGKTFGPYTMILNVKITADKSRLYYVATEKDKTWFACTDGRKVQVGGMPEDFKFSPDGRNALIKMTGMLSMSDIQKLMGQAPEKVAAAMKDNDKKFLYAIDGRKFGPFGDGFSEFWFPKNSNVFYYEAMGGKVYRDGVEVPVPRGFGACGFYPSEDGKKYALYTYENLIFSDGAKYPFPLGLLTRAQDGGTVFKWVTLENKKDFVVYQRML